MADAAPAAVGTGIVGRPTDPIVAPGIDGVPPADAAAALHGRPVRRGLPRRPGGASWPPAGFAPVAGAPESAVEASAPVTAEAHTAIAGLDRAAVEAQVDGAPAPEASASTRVSVRRALAAVGLVLGAAAVVLVARWLRTLDGVQEFLIAYPGEAPMPEGAPVGFPAWLAWQHFFNVFLMVLIVRSGWQVRRERRPAAYWTPRWNPARKIGLNLWFHQSLDLLWLVNGVVFAVLLFATGQWMRIVPTSWAVVPNAISAGLQYASLDWPTENGWVHYNGLQQLAYFATVFVAAPLAVITGVRMSGLWPARATALSRIYPVELARVIHFPVMLYFIAFVVAHVALVLATGALRNLNHMYGGQDAVDWVGFAVFAVSLLVIAAAWVAARPLVLAPIAGLFGRVSNR
ncbi:cytochrome b/b6 domain-containing protein [Agromyces sp. SYSU T00266]|uniref:cytochrome b/b6 domain-containing protein n=1 Tax=Agromyces zhanjiangensis TaxID=3158562 RepID=UPI00339B3DCD